MKKMSKKIVAIIVAILIIVGITVILTKGLNFELRNQNAKKMELYIEKQFEIGDIQSILNEVMPNQETLIQKVEVYEDTVSIIAKEITDEQKTNIINKVNEKYGTELSAETTEITKIPNTRGRDILKPYMVPFIIATIIILVYIAIRYYKLGVIKTIAKTCLTLILSQAVLLSIIAIIKIPIGRLTMPMVLIVYILAIAGITVNFEKQLKIKNEQKE